MPDAPRAGTLGFSGVGLAVPEHARSSRALRPRARQAPQEANRLGTADAALEMLLLVRRWWPEREIVAVADSGYTCIRLLASCQRFLPKPVSFVTRRAPGGGALRTSLAASRLGQMGRARLKGKRLPTLAVVASDPSTL